MGSSPCCGVGRAQRKEPHCVHKADMALPDLTSAPWTAPSPPLIPPPKPGPSFAWPQELDRLRLGGSSGVTGPMDIKLVTKTIRDMTNTTYVSAHARRVLPMGCAACHCTATAGGASCACRGAPVKAGRCTAPLKP